MNRVTDGSGDCVLRLAHAGNGGPMQIDDVHTQVSNTECVVQIQKTHLYLKNVLRDMG